MIKKYVAPVLVSLLALIWLFISLRVEILPLAILLQCLIFAPIAKNKLVWAISVFVIVLCYTFSPVAITYKNAEGFPKLVGYCNINEHGNVYEEGNRESFYENQREGNCVIASDIVSGFEAKWFIVW